MSRTFEHVGQETWERGRSFRVRAASALDAVAAVQGILTRSIWDASFIPHERAKEASLVHCPRPSAAHNADVFLRQLVGAMIRWTRDRAVPSGSGGSTLTDADKSPSPHSESQAKAVDWQWSRIPELHGLPVERVVITANAARREVLASLAADSPEGDVSEEILTARFLHCFRSSAQDMRA
jgi:hypothetical protein